MAKYNKRCGKCKYLQRELQAVLWADMWVCHCTKLDKELKPIGGSAIRSEMCPLVETKKIAKLITNPIWVELDAVHNKALVGLFDGSDVVEIMAEAGRSMMPLLKANPEAIKLKYPNDDCKYYTVMYCYRSVNKMENAMSDEDYNLLCEIE